MSSLNRVIILGNLGADPELRHTQSGQAVCTLSVATTDRRKDAQGNVQEFTEWHRIVVWGNNAENCSKYLAKGRSVCVEGRLTTRSWEDKDGAKKYVTEIVAQNVQFLGGGVQVDADKRTSDRAGGRSDVAGSRSNSAGNGRPNGGQNVRGGRGGGGNNSYGGGDTPSLDDIPF